MHGLVQTNKLSTSEAVHAGLVAGVLAGIAMAMVSMVIAMMTGEGIWSPVKDISVTVLGASAVEDRGFQMLPVLLGMMIHFATAIAFGIVFAILGGRRSLGPAPIIMGIAYGSVIWVVMQFAVLPILNPAMAQMSTLRFATLHIIFGATLGSYPAFIRPLLAERETQTERPSRAA